MPMPDGSFKVQVVRGVPVVTAPEEIDSTNAPCLWSALLEAAAQGPGPVVVDMTRTEFCDSSGIRALLRSQKQALNDGREVLLATSGPAVVRVFQLTGTDHIIRRFASLDEALGQTHAAVG
jgi:anti-sigma B factor antagonist